MYLPAWPSGDEIFGPSVEYTDQIHEEIFGTVVASPVSQAPASPLHNRPHARTSPVRPEPAIQEEEVEENQGDTRRQQTAGGIWLRWPPVWRNRILTNPHARWTPPDTVRRLEKPVEITEL
jgi:hypothetical protein